MRRILLLAGICLASTTVIAQVDLWTEGFGEGCNQGQLYTSYASPNGNWTQSLTGLNEASSSNWYVSATENNTGEGNCGAVCGTNATLHIGAPSVLGLPADPGAAYYEGLAGFCGLLPCGATSKRIESPAIDCSGHENITFSFLYIEGGNAIDNATVWYSDGETWEQIDDPAKTFSGLCSPQGQWTALSLNLPESANDNPNVKIGFQWINNDDGDATDPSFAVDDILIQGTVIDTGINTCPGDFDLDGTVGTGDLLLFLGNYGCMMDCQYQMDNDDIVTTADLLLFLEVYGQDCPE